MSQIDISFITAVYNCLSHTQAFLRTLNQTITTTRSEVILIDDLSTDGSREFLGTLSDPPFRVLYNAENEGYARSNNRGAQEARGELLCFLNNDLILTPDWLQPMRELFSRESNVGAVGNVQVNPRTKSIDHAGVFFDLKGRPSHALKGQKHFPDGACTEWNAVTAACLLVPSRVFREVGGFDESYRNGYEDVDLCVRLRRRNYRLLVSHASVIEHHGRASPTRKQHDRRNLRLFLSKWQQITRRWGQQEWPREYHNKYAERWWKANPLRLALASWLLRSSR